MYIARVLSSAPRGHTFLPCVFRTPQGQSLATNTSRVLYNRENTVLTRRLGATAGSQAFVEIARKNTCTCNLSLKGHGAIVLLLKNYSWDIGEKKTESRVLAGVAVYTSPCDREGLKFIFKRSNRPMCVARGTLGMWAFGATKHVENCRFLLGL